MNDRRQSSGWWQATDGTWYPQQPGPLPSKQSFPAWAIAAICAVVLCCGGPAGVLFIGLLVSPNDANVATGTSVSTTATSTSTTTRSEPGQQLTCSVCFVDRRERGGTMAKWKQRSVALAAAAVLVAVCSGCKTVTLPYGTEAGYTACGTSMILAENSPGDAAHGIGQAFDTTGVDAYCTAAQVSAYSRAEAQVYRRNFAGAWVPCGFNVVADFQTTTLRTAEYIAPPGNACNGSGVCLTTISHLSTYLAGHLLGPAELVPESECRYV